MIMSQLFDYEIPVLHPLAVHFPVGLLCAAALAAIVWVVSDKESWLHVAAFVQTLGSAGAAFAYITGDAMLEHSSGSPVVEQLAAIHQKLALATLIASAVAAALLMVSRWFKGSRVVRRMWYRIGTLMVLMVGLASCRATAHVGGSMVWGVAG
jgi:uncharacterized membrane protein